MLVFLDTGPLGVLCNPRLASSEGEAIRHWARQMSAVGHYLIVPAIADYEVRRELLLRNSVNGLALLDGFIAAIPGRYLALEDAALKLAADLWAQARIAGIPTADQLALDGDVLLAAQVLNEVLPDEDYWVATINVGHLSRFVRAANWHDIPA